MDVVGGNQLEPEFLGPFDQMPVDLGLLGNAVVLEFEIKILRAERLFEPIDGVARFVQFVAG